MLNVVYGAGIDFPLDIDPAQERLAQRVGHSLSENAYDLVAAFF